MSVRQSAEEMDSEGGVPIGREGGSRWRRGDGSAGAGPFSKGNDGASRSGGGSGSGVWGSGDEEMGVAVLELLGDGGKPK